MKCTKCGLEKPDYHFVQLNRGKTSNVSRYFFANPDAQSTQCWACNSDYRCLGCGEVKDASEFRVGGRFCEVCRINGNMRVNPHVYARQTPVLDDDSDPIAENAG